jgi:putative copper resistance protein D
LLSVPYGQLLTAKLTLVIVAVVLGAYNRMIYLPRFSRVAGGEDSAVLRALRSFERLLVLEALAMLGVLIVAAILGHTSPSGG